MVDFSIGLIITSNKRLIININKRLLTKDMINQINTNWNNWTKEINGKIKTTKE